MPVLHDEDERRWNPEGCNFLRVRRTQSFSDNGTGGNSYFLTP